MGRYAKGKHAYGFCDLTGFRYPYKDLVEQYKDGKPTGLMVGKDMVDIDHEQYRLDRVRTDDPKSLRNPRPDPALQASRNLGSFDPVGQNYQLRAYGYVGTVTVVTS